MRDHAAAASSGSLSKVVALGIAPWGLVRNRNQLVNHQVVQAVLYLQFLFIVIFTLSLNFFFYKKYLIVCHVPLSQIENIFISNLQKQIRDKGWDMSVNFH